MHYQARDMAVVRANLGRFPVILSSATPSIESHVNARTGRYRSVVLPGRVLGRRAARGRHHRHAQRRRPSAASGWRRRWSPPSTRHWRAGSSRCCSSTAAATRPLTLCRSCGHRFDCPQCTAWLVEHRYRNRLNCHHCGFSLPLPEKCPKCGDVDSLVACGPGVERIAEEVGERFPDGAAGAAVVRPGALAHRDARDHQDHRGRRGRHRHRHADGGQGPPLPAARHRRRGRRRPGARHRRPAAPPSAPSSSCTR